MLRPVGTLFVSNESRGDALKKAPFILFCFLFVGLTPPDQELTLIRADGVVLSNVSLLRLDGDRLLVMHEGDTLRVPVEEITELSSRSLVLGFPGCWFGLGAGAALGAACAAVTGPYESPNGSDVPAGASIWIGAWLGGCVGMFGGCIIFPEDEERYVLSDKSLDAKKTIISSFLARHAAPHG
jgi:hypothetical protein